MLAAEAHLLETALVPGSGVVEPQAIHGDDRRSLKLAPPATARFRVRVPAEGVLAFGLAARPVGVPLALQVDADGARLHQERAPSVAAWSERRVDLARLAGRDVELRVTVEGRLDLVALGEPRLLAPRPAPPNIVVYVVDCMRGDRLGAAVGGRGLTPTIDALVRESAVFERAYSCAAWTKPSVGCLFTGVYSVRHGARSTDEGLDPERVTLAHALGRAGYATAAIVANPVLDGRGFGFSRGFDSYVELAREWKGRAVNSTPADAAQVTDAALAWIGNQRDQPFFLYAHSIDLHYPYLARPGFEPPARPQATELERDSDLYDSELAYTDGELGRLLSGLARLGLDARTHVLLTADHGEEFGEHGSSRHGRTLFDTLLHVPFVVRLAGTPHGRRLGAPVGLVDVMPTLLDLAGAAHVAGLDGVSLKSALDGGAPPAERPLFAEQVSGGRAIYAVRRGRHKLIRQLLPDPGQLLFDVVADPLELNDILAERRVEALRLDALLQPFLAEGQEGLHLLIADPPPGRPLRLELRSAARLLPPLRLTQVTGDHSVVAPDGRTARLQFVPGGPSRHLVIRTQPPAAPVLLDAVGAWRAADLRLGADGRRAASLPMALVPSALRVAAPPHAGPLPEGAWAFALLRESSRALRPELQEQMRALGYLQ